MTNRFRFHSHSVEAYPDPAGEAARWIRELATQDGLAEEGIFRLNLCANEVLANVADHGYRKRGGRIDLELMLDRDAASLTVIDAAAAFDPIAPPLPPLARSLDAVRDGGWGLRLLRRFADDLHYGRACARSLCECGITRAGGGGRVDRFAAAVRKATTSPCLLFGASERRAGQGFCARCAQRLQYARLAFTPEEERP